MTFTKIIISQLAFVVLQTSLALALLPVNYESRNASDKQSVLWTQLSQQPYPADTLPTKGPSALEAAKVLIPTYLRHSFTHVSDEMMVGRQKIIHTYGTCAKAHLISFLNSSFTGIFRTGAPGIARASVVRYDTTNLLPSVGFKALIDGQPSVNFHILYSPNGQGANKNYFQNNVSNIIPDGDTTALKVVATAFEATIRLLGLSGSRPEDANSMPLYEHAAVQSDGSNVTKGAIRAPWRIDFVPNPALSYSVNETADFRVKVREVPPGTVLYTLVAYYTKAQALVKSGGETIGQLVTDSKFIASAYCDETLYLNHASKPWKAQDMGPG